MPVEAQIDNRHIRGGEYCVDTRPLLAHFISAGRRRPGKDGVIVQLGVEGQSVGESRQPASKCDGLRIHDADVELAGEFCRIKRRAALESVCECDEDLLNNAVAE